MNTELPEALRALAERTPPPAAPVEELVRRGRRTRRTRAAALGGAVVAASVAVTGVALVPDAPDTVAPPALISSSDPVTTFKVNATYTLNQKGRTPHVERYVGAFDSAHHTGYLRGTQEVRLFGKDGYVKRGKWKKVNDLFDAVTRGTLSPADLNADSRAVLRALGGKVVRVNATTFTVTAPARPVAAGLAAGKRIEATLVLDPATKRLKKITQTTVLTGPEPAIADRTPVHFVAEIELSAYGTPVVLPNS
ncbi:hypothetical protein [Actinomadura hibisca]|uniref:hypothetical protein n=1 Tax=Actinomadura hibisca TaxID=68565 RepID=UPI00083438C0|nr:hypothetical protein [Actinomadura hibisca]